MTATFSADRWYRFSLVRDMAPMLGLEGRGTCLFIMLNPSTADEHHNDPTVRRCIDFTRRWGYGRLIVTNLSPLRATDPSVLKAAGPEPVDVFDENLREITLFSDMAQLIVAAWGLHGEWENRAGRVMESLSPWADTVNCLGTTKAGHPRHPLYVKSDIQPVRFPL